MCEFVYWALPCLSGVFALGVLLFHAVAAFVNAIKKLRKGESVGDVADELANELEDALHRGEDAINESKEEKHNDV